MAAPEHDQIVLATSKDDMKLQILAKLRSKEVHKTRMLLASAVGHANAFKLQREVAETELDLVLKKINGYGNK